MCAGSTTTTAKQYLYGMRVRGFSIGTQPAGHTAYIAPESTPEAIQDNFREPDYRFGIVVYPAPLSARDIEHYSLTDLNVPSRDEQFEIFKTFAAQMKEYGETFDDFCQDYIHPKGELRSENPLKDMPHADFFALLQQKGYPGRLIGLEKLFQAL